MKTWFRNLVYKGPVNLVFWVKKGTEWILLYNFALSPTSAPCHWPSFVLISHLDDQSGIQLNVLLVLGYVSANLFATWCLRFFFPFIAVLQNLPLLFDEHLRLIVIWLLPPSIASHYLYFPLLSLGTLWEQCWQQLPSAFKKDGLEGRSSQP